MQLMRSSICGAIANSFRLPNFCRCNEAPLGGELTCQVGLGNIISIGASAFIFPCGTPASLGYRAWASLLGMSRVCLLHIFPSRICSDIVHRALEGPGPQLSP
jgi:hypothetical protein